MRKLFLLLLLAVGPPVMGQVNLDSLLTVWRSDVIEDSLRLKAVHTIAKRGYLYAQPDSSFFYATLQFELARELGNEKQMAEAVNTKGVSYAIRGNLKEALSYFQEYQSLSDQFDYKKGMAGARFNIGNVYLNQGDQEQAIRFFNESLAINQSIDNKAGMTRLLHGIGRIMENRGEYDGAIEQYQKSWELEKAIGDLEGGTVTLISIGIVYKKQGNYAGAINAFDQSLKVSEEIGDQYGMSNALENIGHIHRSQKAFAKAQRFYKKALSVVEEMGDQKGEANALMSLGNVYADQGLTDRSIDYYLQSLSKYEELGNPGSVAICFNNLGLSYIDQQNYQKALDYFFKSLELKEETGSMKGIPNTLSNIAEAYYRLRNYEKALPFANEALSLSRAGGAKEDIVLAAQTSYRINKAMNRTVPALEMHELFISTRDSIQSEENQRASIRQEFQYDYEKKSLADSLEFARKEAVKDLELEKQEAELTRQRIALFSISGGLLLLVSLAVSVYKGKKRSDELLLNILPAATAAELKSTGRSEARYMEEVSVLFTDFKDFTPIAAKLGPEELVADINECFSAFDRIMEQYGIEKIKTIGDAYMAASGLPTPVAAHAHNMVKAALAIRDFMDTWIDQRKRQGKSYFEIRIGVHSGPVVAGIVGLKKFQYDIWGDTVNTASRMESAGTVGKVNISKATFDRVKEQFTCSYRGKILTKGKGEADMYFVEKQKA